ncbi:MAG TPA: ATP-binding protein [Victivallales bacterium]|nr:ATP-binding protein [Victivallales bacterium]
MKTKTVFLVAGQLGSGKTTYAKKLEIKYNAVRFTPDEWMLNLYDGIVIPNKEFDKFFYRCCDLCWSIAEKFLAYNADIILDFGFWKKADRDKYRKLIVSSGWNIKLIYIKCPDNLIRTRIHERNSNLPYGCYYITDDMYNYFSPGFEEPLSDENPEIINNN